jgi:eukaryotic-like serine/threonine-protein kinase
MDLPTPSPQEREAALFALAVEKPAAERPAWLQAVCGGDDALRQRLETLLAAHEHPDPALDAATGEARPTVKLDLGDVPDEAVGQTLGRYKLLEKIGEGGCGVVYVAEQTEPVRRRVALKVIKLGMDTKQVVARFEAERQALAMMDHPNIARVLDAGVIGQRSRIRDPRSAVGAADSLTSDLRPPTFGPGRPYFVMELVRGIKVTDYCDQAKLGTRERLDLFIKVCQAIQHAHQKGIIHRDIKPSNILVTLHDGVPVPKVIDFGIAKATEGRLTDNTVYTQLHQFIGTPAYMSPEQAEMSGLDIDTRSDIYSLGVVLYELLAGSTPFDAKELMAAGVDAMRRTIREKEPPRPSTRLTQALAAAEVTRRTPGGVEESASSRRRLQELVHQLKGDLDWIVMKCLEKDRARRYETANGLAADIKRHLNHEPVVARPPSKLYEFQKMVRRHTFGFAAAGAIMVVLAAGIALTTWQAFVARKAQREAETARAGETTQRQAAEAAQASEMKLRKLAQLQAYAADLKAAQAALQQNSRQQAVTLLDQYWPKPGEPDLRGVEWRYLWQAAKGDEIYTWNHPGRVAGARFSADGKQLATACFDGILRIWNVSSGKLVSQYDRGVADDHVRVSFCYFPDGATLVTAARDGIVLLDGMTGGLKRTLELPETELSGLTEASLACSPDGQWLALASASLIRLWSTASWESFTLPVSPAGRIAFSPDSQSLAFSSGGAIESWDVAARKKAASLVVPSTSPGLMNAGWYLARFSPQGDRLLSSGSRGSLALWDIRSGKMVWSETAHRSRVWGLAFSHDGKRFASGGYDSLIHLWDAATQEKVMTLKGHLNEIWSLEFSPDDRHLLTSSKDGTVKLWDAQAKPQPDHWMLDQGEWPMGFTPDGRGLLSISDGGATLRHWKGAHVIKSLPGGSLFQPASTVFAPESQSLYALRSDGEVRIYDVHTLKVKRSFKISEPCTVLYSVSPDGRWLAGRGTTTQELHVWDTGSGQSVAHIEEFGGKANSRNLAVFSPDSQVLAVATDRSEVKLWDTSKWQVLRTLGPHPWVVYGMSFSPDGRRMASSSWEGDVRVSDIATGTETVPPLYGHGSGVHGHSFSADGATLVSGGDDLSVRFWHAATGREMLVFADAYNQLARLPFLSPTGELLVYQDPQHNLRVRVQAIPTLAEIEKMHEAQSTAR